MNEEHDIAKGPSEEQISAFHKRELIQKIRFNIEEKVGDNTSLLGTTSDATQLIFYNFALLITKLHTANSLAEVRAAAEPFAEISTNFLAKVEGGEVKLPFMDKGIESVVTDIEQRATAVAEVLQTVTKGD